MSMNLNLTKRTPPSRKGERPIQSSVFVYQTPTTLTERCRPVLQDRFKVLRLYKEWLESEEMPNLKEHLAEIEAALQDGFSWGIA